MFPFITKFLSVTLLISSTSFANPMPARASIPGTRTQGGLYGLTYAAPNRYCTSTARINIRFQPVQSQRVIVDTDLLPTN